MESVKLLRNKRVFTFLPAWLSINTIIGAWITLGTLILTYPNPAADMRHPGQLLYGGFSKEFATLLLGGFGLVFLLGMGLWMLILPRLQRTTVMGIGLGGLAITILSLSLITSLGENPTQLSKSAMSYIFMLLPFFISGVVLLSGFTPAALTQLAAILRNSAWKAGCYYGVVFSCIGYWTTIGSLSWWSVCRSKWLLWIDGILRPIRITCNSQCCLYAFARS